MLRAPILIAALAIVQAQAQPTSRWVDVVPLSNEVDDDVEKRYTSELVSQLQVAKADALLLYTEYSARTGAELKIFLRNMSRFSGDMLGEVDRELLNTAESSADLYNIQTKAQHASSKDGENKPSTSKPLPCRDPLEKRVKKAQYDAQRAASFSAENHHKFFLGHMIVFRMHLNKSEEYIKKCERALENCGLPCESSPKVMRWRHLAKKEINRVRDDMQHSRLSYKDILTHAHRKLNNLRKQAHARAWEAINGFHVCLHNA